MNEKTIPTDGSVRPPASDPKPKGNFDWELIPCASYARVSTDEQARDDRYSIRNQEDMALEAIRANQHKGWAHRVSIKDEGYGGYLYERPGLLELLRLAKMGEIKMVVVYRRDRIFRERDLARYVEPLFQKYGVGLYSCAEGLSTYTPQGKLFTAVLDEFAEYERSAIRSRVHDAIRLGAKDGEWKGGNPPFGYSYTPGSKTLEIVESEALIVRYIYQRIAEGTPASELAAELRDKKFYGRSYRPMKHKR